MATEKVRTRGGGIWELVNKQHGVVTKSQLAERGIGAEGIRHRQARGRLYRLTPGVYAVGRPELDDRGWWMAAVLACGPQALLSHRSAAALMGINKPHRGPVEVVVPAGLPKRRAGIRAYRRGASKADRDEGDGGAARSRGPLAWRVVEEIPVTGPAVILVDLATCLPTGQLEAAINEADHRELVDPESLRSAADELPRRPGARRLRTLLDRAEHALTTTELERRFLPLVDAAGLPLPVTQAQKGRHRVDFFWAELGLIVETDSLRYHRTSFKQAADARRDNAHAASGLTTLRFTHGQVCFEADYVRTQLQAQARRLAR